MTGSSTYAQRARALVERWLDSPAGELQIDEEGTELRDLLADECQERLSLERRIADALRRAEQR